MKFDESIKDFSNIFLHMFYEFPEEDMDWDLFKEKFQRLVQISLEQSEFESLVDNDLPTFINHETPLIPDEEPTSPFVPCPPPISFLNKVASGAIVEVVKS